jgi:hypothetical protein
MSYVFISHVEEDQEIAKRIARALEAAGFKAWYYERDSIPGPSYLTQILDAIQESAAIIVIISKDSIGSWQVDKEVIQVHETGKPFIPLLKGITHADFRHRKPDWAMAMGAAASTPIPPEGVGPIMPRIIAGLHWVGVPATGQAAGPAPQGAPPPEPAQPANQPAAPGTNPTPAPALPSRMTPPPSAGPAYPQPVPVVQLQPTVLAPNAPSVKDSVRHWEWHHSWWMLWLLTLGCLNGIAFLWIGYRVQERKWVGYGFLYLLPFMFAITLGWTSEAFLGFCIIAIIGVFIGSLIHGIVVRQSYLHRLQQMQSTGAMQVS